MGVAHVRLVHRDLCECKVKGFRAVSFIERNVLKRRHLQGVRHSWIGVVLRVTPSRGILPGVGGSAQTMGFPIEYSVQIRVLPTLP